jgi:hypothetical protein
MTIQKDEIAEFWTFEVRWNIKSQKNWRHL